MRHSKVFVFFILLALSACGYRGDDDGYENVFEGTWELETISCYGGSDSAALENYSMTGQVQSARFDFYGRGFIFSAQIDGVPGCNVNATGMRAVEYSSQTNGYMSFYKVGSHTNCAPELNELNGLATNVPVPFGINEVVSQGLPWEIDSDSLRILLPMDFKGSLAGPCSQSCSCVGSLTRI